MYPTTAKRFFKAMIFLGTAFATVPQSAYAQSAVPATEPSATPVIKLAAPATLAPVVTNFKKLFDNGVAADWDAAAKTFADLKSSATALTHEKTKPTKEQKARLTQITKHVAEIKKAIDKKDAQALLDSSNRGLRVTQVLASTYASPVPQSIWQLQYLARDVGVWSTGPANLQKLTALPARLDAEWTKIAPDLQSHGGSAIVTDYTTSMASLKAATTPEDFRTKWKPLAEILDKAEAAYLK